MCNEEIKKAEELIRSIGIPSQPGDRSGSASERDLAGNHGWVLDELGIDIDDVRDYKEDIHDLLSKSEIFA